MITLRLFLLTMVVSSFIYSCSQQGENSVRKDDDIVFQYSTITALSEGVFEGDMTIKELKERGDFGLGTFNGLDGELIVIDGKVYQIKADGIAYLIEGSRKTPFSIVTFFKTDRRINIENEVSCEKLEKIIDKFIPTKNIIYGIRIDGLFEYVKTRSVSKQNKPFPKLTEALKNEPIFEFNNLEGTVAGFRFPIYMESINVPGYHFHFITEDRKAGGHLLECRVKDLKVDIDYSYELDLKLPQTEEFYKFNSKSSLAAE